jgi:hypothetical protein
MLSQEADDPATTTGKEPSQAMDSEDLFDPPADYDAHSVFDMFSGDLHRLRIGERPTLTIDKVSPMFSPEYPLSEHLTLPVDELTTPHSEHLKSPVDDSLHLGSKMLTNPLMSDVGMTWSCLVGCHYLTRMRRRRARLYGRCRPHLIWTACYAMPSPVSHLDPSSVYTSPYVTMSPPFPLLSSSKAKSTATGT